jgi:hypothetical protein
MEDTGFDYIPPRVLAIASKQGHARYFEDCGLSAFVSRFSQENQPQHSVECMSELIQNFDPQRQESKVNDTVVSFTVESVKAMFGLESGGPAADTKVTNYSPKTFSSYERGSLNRAYKLQSCTDRVVMERLEFQLVALYLKGKRVETAPLYHVKQVEECVRADWTKCFALKLVERMSKCRQTWADRGCKPVCAFASHLQVILNNALGPPSSAVQAAPVPAVVAPPSSTVQVTMQPVESEQKWACRSWCTESIEELKRDRAEMTSRVRELTEELGEIKALFGNLAKELREHRTTLVR